jgi:uncharacterized protein (TIGR03435 family)
MESGNFVVRTSSPLRIGMCAIAIITPLTGADQPKFETASVRRTDRCSLQNSVDPGMITLNGDPLNLVLKEAFKVNIDQIVGPSWLDADCFQIVASLPGGASKDQIPGMLQTLLAERFKLAVHKENRTLPGYALVVDRNGSKLKESDPTSPSNVAHAGQVTFGAARGAGGIKGSMTMASLARFVSNRLNVPVQDLTGLKDKYDVDLWWVPDPDLEKIGPFAQSAAAAHPGAEEATTGLPNPPTVDLFTAIRNSLGLRLEQRKEQVEFVVIDHIERVPSEN